MTEITKPGFYNHNTKKGTYKNMQENKDMSHWKWMKTLTTKKKRVKMDEHGEKEETGVTDRQQPSSSSSHEYRVRVWQGAVSAPQAAGRSSAYTPASGQPLQICPYEDSVAVQQESDRKATKDRDRREIQEVFLEKEKEIKMKCTGICISKSRQAD